MFGNLGEMAKMMQKAKDIQKNMAAMKEAMANSEFSGSAPGNQVTARVTGDFMLKGVSIAPEAMADRELLEDQLTVAINNAMTEARKAAAAQMSEVTGGLNIPGLF